MLLRARKLSRTVKGQVTASGLGSPHGRQLGVGLHEVADPSQRSSPGRADLVEVEPGVLMADAVEISPGRVLSEDELQLYLPVLRLLMGIVALIGLGDGNLPAKGQCRLIVVPVPPAPFDDEAVAIVLRPLDPCDLDLEKLTERFPRGPHVTYSVGLDPTLSQDLRERVGAGPPRNGHAGCYRGDLCGSGGSYGGPPPWRRAGRRTLSKCVGGVRAGVFTCVHGWLATGLGSAPGLG